MPIAEGDCQYTTFLTILLTSVGLSFPIGLRNNQTTFERSLDLIISEVRFKTGLVYLDNLLIFLQQLEDRIEHVEEVLTLLENFTVLLSTHKFQFFRKSLDNLSHVLTPVCMAIAKD